MTSTKTNREDFLQSSPSSTFTYNYSIESMLNQALAYARKGFFIFPCGYRDKKPITSKGMLEATTDEKQIQEWWKQHTNANIGINCKKSGILVIDIDVSNDKTGNRKNGDVEFNQILKESNFTFPDTPTILTPTGGIHYYFKTPEGIKFSGMLKGCKYVDIKHNGYVLAAGSIHPNGGCYQWIEDKSIFDIQPATIPEELLKYMIPDAIKEVGTSNPVIKTNRTNTVSHSIADEYNNYYSDTIVARCPFIKYCIDNNATLPEPLWFAMAGVLSRTTDGYEAFHKYSCNYPGYSVKETDDKFQHALNDSTGATTCNHIESLYAGCLTCKYYNEIISPISLGIPPIDNSFKSCNSVFPIDSLPTAFKNYAEEASEALNAPVDYISMVLLVVASALIGNSTKIQIINSWLEPSLLWGCLVGAPGSKKTPCFNAVTELLDPIISESIKIYQANKEIFKNDLKIFKVKEALWEKNCKDNKSTSIEQPIEPAKPTLKTIYTRDTTCEALAEQCKYNPKGILYLAEELAGAIRGCNQYKGGKGSDRTFLLEAWNSVKNHTITRKGKEPDIIPYLTISIIGSIQPGVLKEVLLNTEASDGFFDRFLFCYPEYLDDGSISNKPINRESKAKVEEIFVYFNNLDSENPEIVSIDAMGFKILDEYCRELQGKINSKQYNESICTYLAKQKGYTARLALVLHKVKEASKEFYSVAISPETMQQAVNLSKYFSEQAINIILSANLTDKKNNPQSILDYMTRKNIQKITARDIARYLKSNFKTVENVKQAFDELKSMGRGIIGGKGKNIFIKN